MIICITGVSGVGKSTALKIIQKQGFKTFEMDQYIHDIYRFNEIGYNLIKKTFGNEYVNKVEVDRKKLGKLVFGDNNKLLLLNKLVQPLMTDKLKELAKNHLIYVELAIYLNYLDVFEPYFDEVILIVGKRDIVNENNKKKFSHVGKFSTMDVGNTHNPIKTPCIQTNLIVNNIGSIEEFGNDLKKMLEKINKTI